MVVVTTKLRRLKIKICAVLFLPTENDSNKKDVTLPYKRELLIQFVMPDN